MYVGVVIVALLWLALRARYGSSPMPQLPSLRIPWLVPACAAAVAVFFVAQLLTIAYVATHQSASQCYLHLPVPVVADFNQETGGPALFWPSALLGALAVTETLLLAVMYCAARQRPPSNWEWRATAAICACALGAAVAAPAMTSPDPFMYFSFAKIGFASFAASPHLIHTPDLPLGSWCQRLLLPSAYGPLFVTYERALLGGVHDPVIAVYVLRGTNALWLLAAVLLLHRVGAPASVLPLMALNPTVLFQYVAGAHNDIVTICLILAAVSVEGAGPALTAALVVAAGLVKLPFAVIGALAFVREPSLARRIAYAAGALALTLAISYLWAGRAYFEALSYYHSLLSPSSDRLQILVTVVALAAICVAIFTRRFAGVGAFAFPTLSVSEMQPWYALWGLPYAVREHRHLALFLILLPPAGFLMDDSISRIAQLVIFAGAVCIVAALAVRDLAYGKRTA